MGDAHHGDEFQQATQYERGHLPGGGLDWEHKPAPYKRYPAAPQIALSPPDTKGGPSVWDTLHRRRSVRRFRSGPLPEKKLSQLLWAAQGVTRAGRNVSLRTAPSAGALYPIETYLVIHNVAGIEPGVYHYAVEDHALEQLKTGDYRTEITQAALDQEMAYHANMVLVWTAVFERSKWKYRQRAYRYIYLDAGHIAQNVALGAVALGLGSCQIAALYDGEVNALLDVDGTAESAIYLTVIGKP